MENKMKKIFFTLFLALIVLLVSPTSVFANGAVIYNPEDQNEYGVVVSDMGTGTPSVSGSASLSGLSQHIDKSGSNFYQLNGSPWICVTASRNRPRGSGHIYEEYNLGGFASSSDPTNGGLSRLYGKSKSQLAVSIINMMQNPGTHCITVYSHTCIEFDGDYYIIGHAILSGLIGNDWGLYNQIHSYVGDGTGNMIGIFVDHLLAYMSDHPANTYAHYYIFIPDDGSTQSLITTKKPTPPTPSYGGIAIQKYINGSKSGDLSGYQFKLYRGSCNGEYINTFTTDGNGQVKYYGSGTSVSTSDIPLRTTFCFREVVDGNGYAMRNGQATEFKPAGDVTVSASENPTTESLIGKMYNNSTSGGKGYIVIRKTVTSNTGLSTDSSGYIFTIYHSSCDSLQNRVAQIATDNSGKTTYGYNVTTGEGVLEIGDTYCVKEEVSDSGKAYRNTGEGGTWVETEFKPTNNPVQVNVNGGANYVNFENRDDEPGGHDYCLKIQKYMQNDDGSLEKLDGVPFVLRWYYFDGSENRQKSINLGTAYTDSNGVASWKWNENYLPVQTYSPGGPFVRDFYVTEGLNDRESAWGIYLRQDGHYSPYLYAIGPIGTSGPVINEYLYGDIKDQSSSVCDNNFGLGCGYETEGSHGDRMPTCDETTPTGLNPEANVMKELVDTKVYFCLRVKKEDENGEKIDPDAFNDMVFEASGNGRTIRTTDTSLSRINTNTGVVSFFTGDSVNTGVNVVPYGFFNDQEICHSGNLCTGPDKLIPVTWQVREISAPTGYTLNTEKVLNVKPIQLKAYMYDRDKPSAYERAKEDCLSGADDKGETFSDYVLADWDETHKYYKNATNYTKISE